MWEPDRPYIIGGMFALAEPLHQRRSAPPFCLDSSLLLANARSGIAVLIELLSPGRVWMPSYFCNHVLQTVIDGRVTVSFYGVNYDLALPSMEWISAVCPGDLVVLADYFGFPCDPACVRQIQKQGALVLEDASQALLSRGVGQCADFVLYSPRKFLGVPDGGILVLTKKLSAEPIMLEPPPAAWWLKAFEAVVLRREFDRHGGDRRWFELFRESEIEGPVGRFAMSELTRLLLLHGFDYTEIAENRVANYRQLASELGTIALFPALPDGVVPLGFPIRVSKRDQLREVLFSRNIYPPVHWPVKGVVPDSFTDSHRLSAMIMTLPCDQRYGPADMERIVSVVKKEMERS